MLKKIVSLTLTASILMSMSAVFAADEEETLPDTTEFDAMQEIENNADNAYESENAVEDMHFYDTESWWFIPEYDKTGMSDYDIIMKNIYYESVQSLGSVKSVDATIDAALADYIEGGYFVGPDYWAWEIGTMPAARHYRYLMNMVGGYQMPESKYYKSEDIWNKMHECIDFWMKTVTRKYVYPGPTYSSWWAATIGRGLAMIPFLALAKGCIEDEVLIPLTEEHMYAARQMAPDLVTGTNAVWYARNSIVKGAILEDPTLVQEGIDIVHKEMSMTTAHPQAHAVVDMEGRKGIEGIQTDLSYHMHGSKYYAGYAGNSFSDFTTINMYAQGTQFEMTDLYDLVTDILCDGWVWIQRGGHQDFNHRGRGYVESDKPVVKEGQMSDDEAIWVSFMRRMARLYPERADELNQSIKYLLPYDDPEREYKVGNKYFYSSDYMAHQREGWTAWSQTNSWRINASEHNMADGVQSYWFGMGTVFMDKGDNIYDGSVSGTQIFWRDQSKMPGVTSSEYVHVSNWSGWTMRQMGKYAGGVSDGMYGMNAMHLVDRAGVSAKKAWFWFDDEYVALGSGITSSSKYNTNTIVDNRRLTTEVEVDGKVIEKGKHELKDVSSVMQYGIGYVFPNKEDITLETGTVVGNFTEHQKWSGVDNTDYTANIFTLYIPHGKKVVNDTYEYICVPETDSEHLAEYVENNPIEIAANTTTVQAVLQKNLNVAGAAFYDAGEVEFSNGLKVKSDTLCCFMAREVDGELKLYVSNPYNEKTTVTLTVTYNGKTEKVKFDLPGIDANAYNYGGKAIEKSIKL